MSFSIKDRIAAGRTDKSWPTIDGKQLDRSQFLTASEALICERRLAFEKRHPEVLAAARASDTGWGYAERGDAYEAWAVQKLRSSLAKDEELMFAGGDQISFYNPDDKISGTPDGVFYGASTSVLLDFKSYDPRKSISAFPLPTHVAQVNINIALVNQWTPPQYTAESGMVSYGNASNFEEAYDFPLVFDPIHYKAAVIKANKIFGTNDISTLEPEGITNGDCRYCLFKSECSKMIGADVEEKAREALTPMDMPEMVARGDGVPRSMKGKVRRFVDNKKKIKELEADNKKMDQDIREYVLKNGGSVTVGSATVEVSQFPGRETVDKAAMAADGIDVAKYIKTGKPFSRMDVKIS